MVQFGDYQNSKVFLEQAVQIEPKFALAWFHLGNTSKLHWAIEMQQLILLQWQSSYNRHLLLRKKHSLQVEWRVNSTTWHKQ